MLIQTSKIKILHVHYYLTDILHISLSNILYQLFCLGMAPRSLIIKRIYNRAYQRVCRVPRERDPAVATIWKRPSTLDTASRRVASVGLWKVEREHATTRHSSWRVAVTVEKQRMFALGLWVLEQLVHVTQPWQQKYSKGM